MLSGGPGTSAWGPKEAAAATGSRDHATARFGLWQMATLRTTGQTPAAFGQVN